MSLIVLVSVVIASVNITNIVGSCDHELATSSEKSLSSFFQFLVTSLSLFDDDDVDDDDKHDHYNRRGNILQTNHAEVRKTTETRRLNAKAESTNMTQTWSILNAAKHSYKIIEILKRKHLKY